MRKPYSRLTASAIREVLTCDSRFPYENSANSPSRWFAAQLREHGFEAYWAGGCVRDQLLARTPYDYDVATSAQPEEIRARLPQSQRRWPSGRRLA